MFLLRVAFFFYWRRSPVSSVCAKCIFLFFSYFFFSSSSIQSRFFFFCRPIPTGIRSFLDRLVLCCSSCLRLLFFCFVSVSIISSNHLVLLTASGDGVTEFYRVSGGFGAGFTFPPASFLFMGTQDWLPSASIVLHFRFSFSTSILIFIFFFFFFFFFFQRAFNICSITTPTASGSAQFRPTEFFFYFIFLPSYFGFHSRLGASMAFFLTFYFGDQRFRFGFECTWTLSVWIFFFFF